MCLDDFGSGYANLNAVLRIPFSAVKMDRSLLSGVSSDPQTATFYRSIVMILQHMGYKVIAEGAETEKEVKLLEKWGVDMIQGYYFSRPLCEEKLLKKFPEMIRNRRKTCFHKKQGFPPVVFRQTQIA